VQYVLMQRVRDVQKLCDMIDNLHRELADVNSAKKTLQLRNGHGVHITEHGDDSHTEHVIRPTRR